MRSTTVGWLTSIERVLPVTADHTRLNKAGPELRDRINHPPAPAHTTPRNSPKTRATPTAAEDREGFGERTLASGSGDILRGYHWRVRIPSHGSNGISG